MIDYQFWLNACILVVTVFAIWFGPIRAVKITRELDERRENRSRKYAILSDLMRTRRARIDPTHVGALNLIELEFYEQKGVIDAFRLYSRNLATREPVEIDDAERFYQERDDLFIELLQKIAAELEYKFDKRDLAKLGYFPEGLSRYQSNSDANAALLREVLEGRRALPISNFVSDARLFPPAPEKKLIEDRTK